MREMLTPLGVDVVILLEVDKADISERQLNSLLPTGPDVQADSSIFSSNAVDGFDAVVTTLAGMEIRGLLKDKNYMSRKDRPAYVSFYAGLEFTPNRGFRNRGNYDIVFLNNLKHKEWFEAEFSQLEWQYVSFGHPYFIQPEEYKDFYKNQGNIYFFTQSISPATLDARIFIVDVLVTLAKRNADRNFFLKLRHLPKENEGHLHREIFDYPWILERYFAGRKPDNLLITACPMSEALADAAACVTCSSTAAMDSVSAGVPTMLYLDYPQNYLDPLASHMKMEFEGSNLRGSLVQLMDLEFRRPNEEWITERFRKPEFINELIAAVRAFKMGDEPPKRVITSD